MDRSYPIQLVGGKNYTLVMSNEYASQNSLTFGVYIRSFLTSTPGNRLNYAAINYPSNTVNSKSLLSS